MQNRGGDRDGCYLTANINGTAYGINQKYPLLAPAGGQLTSNAQQHYYDFSYNKQIGQHISQREARYVGCWLGHRTLQGSVLRGRPLERHVVRRLGHDDLEHRRLQHR
eukprot:4819112-Prymnesium_polylepis.1